MFKKNTPFLTPKSMEELDAVSEQFREALSDVFDFEVGKKKQQKLRHFTSRALGYANGFQQLYAEINGTTSDDNSDQSNTSDLKDLPDTIVLGPSQFYFDQMAVYLGVQDITQLRNGLVEEIDKDANHMPRSLDLNEEDEPEIKKIFGMSVPEFEDVLADHYHVQKMICQIPSIYKCGIPHIAVESLAPAELEAEYGYHIDPNHYEQTVFEKGDTGETNIYLKFVKKKQAEL